MKYAQSLWRRSGVFVVNFEHYLHLFKVFIVNFEQTNVSWEGFFWAQMYVNVSVNSEIIQ